MSVLGIGTDIVSIKRIEQVLQRQPDFVKRILTEQELIQFNKHRAPHAFLAKRWAAKEAAAKAFGTGIGAISFQHISVGHTAAGQPLLSFSGQAKKQADLMGVGQSHLSLSDEVEYAIAYVILSAN